MDLFAYVIIVILVSWPFLLIGLLGTLILAHWKRGFSRTKILMLSAVAIIPTVTATLIIWRFWPEALGGPMYLTYVHGPALVANCIVFAALFWGLSRLQPNKGFNRTPVSSAAAKPVLRRGGAG